LLNNYDNAMKLRVYGSRVFTAVRNFIESVYTKLANRFGHADALTKQLREARDLYRRVLLDAEKAEKRGEKPGEKYSFQQEKTVEKSSKEAYSKESDKGDEPYARSEEFRRIQAECRALSAEQVRLFHSTDKRIDGSIRTRLSRVFQRELDAWSRKRSNGNRSVLKLFSSYADFSVHQEVEASLYHDVSEICRYYLGNGELVDLHPVKTTKDAIGYSDCKNYITDDGLSGFSITPDGDLISVYNLSDKRGWLKAISAFVRQNAKTLDCYVSSKQNLMEMYAHTFGFKTASVMDYNMEYDHDEIAKNHGNPDVAFMVNTDRAVETKRFGKDQYYMACVINVESTKNSFYLHEVAIQEKGDDTLFKTGTDQVGTSRKASSPLQVLLQKLQEVKKKFSFGDIDAAYDRAVADGDVAAQQRLVDEATAQQIVAEQDAVNAEIDAAVEEYDTDAEKKAFVEGYDGTVPVRQYQMAFDYMVEAGKSGMAFARAAEQTGAIGQAVGIRALQNAYGVGKSIKKGAAQSDAGGTVIVLTDDKELGQRIASSKRNKFYVIRDYIIEKFGGQKFRMSDGKQAIVDKSDAQHMAHNASDLKAAEITRLRKIIEQAKLYAEDNNVTHNKFDAFSYYTATVKYGKDTFDLSINVGRAKNDGSYHVYEINHPQNIRDTAGRASLGLGRPKPNEGYALKNGVSNTTVPQRDGGVKTNVSGETGEYTDDAAFFEEATREALGDQYESERQRAAREALDQANEEFKAEKEKEAAAVKKVEPRQPKVVKGRQYAPIDADLQQELAAVGVNARAVNRIDRLAKALDRQVIPYFDPSDAANGMEQNGVLYLNMAKRESRYVTIFGHELTHSVERAKQYGQLKAFLLGGEILSDWLKKQGYADLDEAIQARIALYEQNGKTLDKAGAERDVVADLAGIYLLNNYDNAMKLRVYGSRVFTAVRNFIESVYTKLANRFGHADALTKQLREARDLYRRVLLDAEKAEKRGEKPGEKKYSIGVLQNGNTYVIASRNIITASDVAGMRKEITQFFNDLLEENESVQIPTIHGDILTITKAETANKARDNYTTENGKRVKLSNDKFALKLRAESHIDELAEISTTFRNSADKKVHDFAKDGFSYRRVFFEDFNGKYYSITLSVGNNGTTATVYNVGKIKEDKLPSVKLMTVVGSKPLGKMSSNNRILADEEKVKKNFSFGDLDAAYDRAVADGDVAAQQRLVDEAAERAMPDSAVRNKNGLLKRMHHGTNADIEYTVFDISKTKHGLFGRGHYFTDNKEIAETYEKKGVGNSPRVYTVFLNIKNPLVMESNADSDKWLAAVPELENFIIDATGKITAKTNQDFYRALEDYCAYEKMYQYDAEDFILEAITEMGYDGINYVGGKARKSSTVLHDVWIAFSPSQIKSADPVTYDDAGKVIPLSKRFDPSQNDIRYSFGDLDGYTEEQYNAFGWVRANDIMTAAEYADFRGRLGEMQTGFQFPKDVNGNSIIAVGKANKIQNVLVFVGGTFNKPVIQKVMRINLDNETDLGEARGVVYHYERAGDPELSSIILESVYGNGVFEVRNAEDYSSLRQLQDGRGKRDVRTKTTGNSVGVPNEGGSNEDAGGTKDAGRVNFSLTPSEQMDALVDEYGAIKPGEKATVEIDVPKRTSKTMKTRRFVRTVLESGKLSDEMVEKPGFGKNPEARFYLVISR
jgi:hypothetical protein